MVQYHYLEVELYEVTNDSVYKLLNTLLLHNIQECYCVLSYTAFDLCLVMIELLKFPVIKVLHLITVHLKLKDEISICMHLHDI